MDCSIIIVSWNVADLLVDCLRSIFGSLAHSSLAVEVIVVDSASGDGTPERIQRDFPQVRLFAQTENVGFTKGNNIGLAHATGRYLFLLNPDTVIVNDAIERLIHYLDGNPTVGIVAPHTLNSDGTTQSSRRRFPTRLTAFFESTALQPYAPRHILDQFYMRDYPDDGTFDVDWAQGSALVARREVVAQVGGLDEGYIMYSEELDWCKRVRDAGWRIVYHGQAQIIHHGGKSSEQIGVQKHIYFQQSKLRYFQKYHGAQFATILRLFLLATYFWQLLIEAGKGLLGHKRALRQERVRAYWQILTSGLAAK